MRIGRIEIIHCHWMELGLSRRAHFATLASNLSNKSSNECSSGVWLADQLVRLADTVEMLSICGG
jgi:hypothetical protein